jgi:hypothetical protein
VEILIARHRDLFNEYEDLPRDDTVQYEESTDEEE